LRTGVDCVDARATPQAGLTLDPGFAMRRYRANPPSDNPTFLAGRERIDEGMRLAGRTGGVSPVWVKTEKNSV
jgi:hypothetical protein